MEPGIDLYLIYFASNFTQNNSVLKPSRIVTRQPRYVQYCLLRWTWNSFFTFQISLFIIKNHTAAWRKEQGKSAQRIGIVSGWMELSVHRCRPNMNQSGTVASGWRRSSALTHLLLNTWRATLPFFFFPACQVFNGWSAELKPSIQKFSNEGYTYWLRSLLTPTPRAEMYFTSGRVHLLHVQQIKPWPLGRTPREENIKDKG